MGPWSPTAVQVLRTDSVLGWLGFSEWRPETQSRDQVLSGAIRRRLLSSPLQAGEAEAVRRRAGV